MEIKLNIIGCLVILNFSMLTSIIGLGSYVYINNQESIESLFELNDFLLDFDLIKNNIDSITDNVNNINQQITLFVSSG